VLLFLTLAVLVYPAVMMALRHWRSRRVPAAPAAGK